MSYGDGLYGSWFYGVDGNYVDGAAAISASTTTSAIGQVTIKGASAISASATTSISFLRVVERVIPINVLADMTPIGAINAAAKSTMTPTMTATGSAVRVAQSSITATPLLTVTGEAVRIQNAAATVAASLAIATAPSVQYNAASQISPTLTITAVGNRVQSTGANVAATALFAANARLKWEVIVDPTDTWTPLTDDSVTWTESPMRAA